MRWLRNRSIRSRITSWSVVFAIVFIAIAGIGFRLGVDSIVASSTHALLASDGAPYEAAIKREKTKGLPRPAEDQLVAVVDPTGKIRTSNLPMSLTERMPSLLAIGRGVHVVTARGHIQYDVANETVETLKGDWHIIEARNRAEGQVVLGGLDTVMIVGGIALVLGFGLSAWIVTGLALRPVTRMRRQASRLSQSAGDGVLPVGRVRDELSALAETLNEFITSVRASTDRERQMIADASHELRTPLSVLTTQLQLAHLSSGDAAALEAEIAAAEQTLARLSGLTTSLLTLTKIESAELVPSTAGDAVLREFLGCMDRAILLGSAHSVPVDFTTEGVGPDRVVPVSPEDFAGLVDNLVTNAIAASPPGAAVTVDLTAEDDRIVLSVMDSGHGISDEFLPVAFDRFSRPEASRRRDMGGSGLGLAIVKAIVVRSGGTVGLEQRASGGVLARVELPTTAT